MHIGIDARLAFQTGVGRYVRNLLKELSKIDKKNTYTVFARKEDIKKLKLGKNFQLQASDQKWHSLSEQTSFLRQINSHDIDLMHFTYFSHPILYKKPFVITFHDLIVYHYKTGKASTKNPLLYNIKHSVYKYTIKNAAENAKSIITPSHTVKKDIMRTLQVSAQKIKVTYEGVEKLPKAKKVDVPEKYFLYVGNAYPHKNVQFLADAFVQFRIQHDDVKLLLVGPDDHFYNSLKLDSHITVLHDIDDRELKYLYHHALALVQPSLAEGFGLTPLEAISNGCLVAASYIEIFREILQNNAIYFDPTQQKDLIEKLNEVYNLNDKDKKELISNAKKYATEFNWKKTAEKTRTIYESCLSI